MTSASELRDLLLPEFDELLEGFGQPLELRRQDGQGAWSDDGRQAQGGGTLWVGVGILLPLTDRAAAEVNTGSDTPVPLLQLFLPPDAPVGRPGYAVTDPATGLRYHPRRDAIDWKGIYWDVIVGVPGERSE